MGEFFENFNGFLVAIYSMYLITLLVANVSLTICVFAVTSRPANVSLGTGSVGRADQVCVRGRSAGRFGRCRGLCSARGEV